MLQTEFWTVQTCSSVAQLLELQLHRENLVAKGGILDVTAHSFSHIHIQCVGNPVGCIFKIYPDSNPSPPASTTLPGISYLDNQLLVF